MNYQLILFDQVGFGHSDVSACTPKKYGSLHANADDTLEICQALNLKDVIFVGHSVSAILGVLAANQAPRLSQKFVLIGPSPRYLNDLRKTWGSGIPPMCWRMVFTAKSLSTFSNNRVSSTCPFKLSIR